jgi:hypothetical protein
VKTAAASRKAPTKVGKPASQVKAPVRAAAAKVEGDAGDKLSKPPSGKARKR